VGEGYSEGKHQARIGSRYSINFMWRIPSGTGPAVGHSPRFNDGAVMMSARPLNAAVLLQCSVLAVRACCEPRIPDAVCDGKRALSRSGTIERFWPLGCSQRDPVEGDAVHQVAFALVIVLTHNAGTGNRGEACFASPTGRCHFRQPESSGGPLRLTRAHPSTSSEPVAPLRSESHRSPREQFVLRASRKSELRLDWPQIPKT
jgi:hypothetical protein